MTDLLPRHSKMASVINTVSQIKINQDLIWHSLFVCQKSEILDGIIVDVNSNLLFVSNCTEFIGRVHVVSTVFSFHNFTSTNRNQMDEQYFSMEIDRNEKKHKR